MAKRINIKGVRFGKLTAIESADTTIAGKVRWLCQCDCGTRKVIVGSALKSGNTTSCGCVFLEKLIARNTKHGHATRRKESRTHISWAAMKNRATNTAGARFSEWGGRGITMTKRWLKFSNFLLDMGDRPAGKSLDRINNDGPYKKSNCRWATPREQNLNKRRSKHKGESK